MTRKHYLKTFVISALLACNFANAQQWGNYTLYSTMGGTTTYLIDTNSTNVHTWTHTTTYKTGYSSYLLPGGVLLRTVSKSGNSFTGGPICGEVQKVDWNGTILWDYVYSTQAYCTHHDICPMPNGNVLMISYERKTAAEVAAAGCSTFSSEMWPDKIVEVQPVGTNGGNIVWEWHAWDHLMQNTNSSGANYQSSLVNHPELLNINFSATKDWLHMNGVSYNPILDQVIWSSHNMSEIYVIDHSTTTAQAASHSGGNSGMGGDLLYRWGHPAAYSATGTQILHVVHDAHWNPEGVPNAGYVGGYNNQGVSSSASCADQVSPPYNGYNYSITLGSAFAPANYTIRQVSGGYNSNMGNFQVLPNGNMLLCIATAGIIKEFDAAGNLLWSKTATGSVPKAFRYDSCYVYNAAPAIPTITQSTDTLYATPATTYQWYFNGQLIAGASSQYYVAAQAGNYLVRITDANGCVYVYSVNYAYTGPTGVSSVEKDNTIKIFPNPTTGIVRINYAVTGNDFEIFVADAIGNILISEKNSSSVDLSKYANGIYYITVKNADAGSVTKKISLLK